MFALERKERLAHTSRMVEQYTMPLINGRTCSDDECTSLGPLNDGVLYMQLNRWRRRYVRIGSMFLILHIYKPSTLAVYHHCDDTIR